MIIVPEYSLGGIASFPHLPNWFEWILPTLSNMMGLLALSQFMKTMILANVIALEVITCLDTGQWNQAFFFSFWWLLGKKQPYTSESVERDDIFFGYINKLLGRDSAGKSLNVVRVYSPNTVSHMCHTVLDTENLVANKREKVFVSWRLKFCGGDKISNQVNWQRQLVKHGMKKLTLYCTMERRWELSLEKVSRYPYQSLFCPK